MMDAKQAVEILRREFKLIDKSLGLKPISIDVSNKIADYIEQQAKHMDWQEKEIVRLKTKVREFIHPLDMPGYAQLGRLALWAFKKGSRDLSESICNDKIFQFNNGCDGCIWRSFCKLRAELLKVEGNKNA